jgi:hypothetical protein
MNGYSSNGVLNITLPNICQVFLEAPWATFLAEELNRLVEEGS